MNTPAMNTPALIASIISAVLWVAAIAWGTAFLRLDWRIRLATIFALVATFIALAVWEYA